jgi:hypothetical protein
MRIGLEISTVGHVFRVMVDLRSSSELLDPDDVVGITKSPLLKLNERLLDGSRALVRVSSSAKASKSRPAAPRHRVLLLGSDCSNAHQEAGQEIAPQPGRKLLQSPFDAEHYPVGGRGEPISGDHQGKLDRPEARLEHHCAQ